jgi:uncharacterized membrane protein (DUF485 family)
MKNLSAPEVTSLAGSATAIGSTLTLTDWGVIIGIGTALLTFAINVIYMVRKDRREQRESDAAIAKLEVKP